MARPHSTKEQLHPRNRHREGYDFDALIDAHAALAPFVELNKYGTRSINFFDPKAVRELNAALLALYYNIEWWQIPPSALTPPIPGRADYIHYLADVVGAKRKSVRCLDIGTGASCIYPIIGHAEYGWEFVGSDIDQTSLNCAKQILERNPQFGGDISLRLQSDHTKIFEGVILPGEHFDVTLCNPPFHDSAQSAEQGTRRKLRALGAKDKKTTLNFSGRSNELWCEGGERAFIERMIAESRLFASQCGWFSTLVSKEDNLPHLRAALHRAKVRQHQTIEMHQGNKRSRILMWHY